MMPFDLRRTTPLVLACVLAATACDTDPVATPPTTPTCTAGEATCLDARSYEICTSDGSSLTVVACASDEMCTDGSCVPATPCTAGEATCLSDEAYEVCGSDGLTRTVVACAGFQSCVDGSCVGVCEPGAATCTSRRDASVCADDGLSLTVTPCAVGQMCAAGACVPVDEPGTCQIGDILCSGADMLTCNTSGTGYDTSTCPASATCVPGVGCQGSVCVVGDTSCASTTTLATCVDGEAWEATNCTSGCTEYVNEATLTLDAVCVGQGDCVEGQRVCGDPSSPTYDPIGGYHQCEQVGPRTKWVPYNCGGASECAARFVSGLGHVSACVPVGDCSAFSVRCGTTADVEQCQPDGSWTTLGTCDAGETCVAGNLDPGRGYSVYCSADKCVEMAADYGSAVYGLWANGADPLLVGECQSTATDIQACDFGGSFLVTCPNAQSCVPFDALTTFGTCE